jgi:hypothetical protein
VTARVLVLGCGPSGLISAYAAEREFGAEVKIMSVKRPSQLFGCQYLHEPIPGATLGAGRIVHYRLEGTEAGYRKKVYGSLTPPVSPQQYAGNHLAWDLRQTYAHLWERFESKVIDAKFTSADIVPMLSDFMPDACISSVPASVICQRGLEHNFTSVPSWAMGDAPELGQSVPITPAEDFTVVCSGEPAVSWYRVCKVFGYSTVEWPGYKRKPPFEGVAPFLKPLSTDCDCMPSILRVGRYGRWQKGVLSHEAYNATVRKVQEFV